MRLGRCCRRLFAADGGQSLDAIDRDLVRIVGVVTQLGEDSGTGLLDALAEAESRPAILLLSAHDNPTYLHEAHRLGAVGYFLKALALDVVLEGVRQAVRGQTVWTLEQLARIRAWEEQVKFRWDALTGRERDVLRALAQGKSNREISAELHITERTVEFHVGNILGELGAGSRSQVAVWVRDADLGRFTL